RIGRIERDTVDGVAVSDDETGSGLEVEVRLRIRRGLDTVRGRVQVVRPRRDLRAGTRVDPVVQAEVESPSERPGALLLELVENAELVLGVRDHELVGRAELHDRLVRDSDDAG